MKQREREAAEFWEDGHGVRYWEVPRLARDMDWDKLIRRVDDAMLVFWFKCEHVTETCWFCEKSFGVDCHHICSGGRKSDELCNFLWVCRLCHTVVQSQPSQLKRVFRAKVKHDKANCDWLRLVRLLGRVPFDSLD
jgi:hypothetical protein